MGSRIKKYRMKAIPSAFSEKGGFSAQFIGDGYSVDARTEILPAVISASGVQVGEGTAWELVTAFLKACAQRAANTGETVNVGSLVTFGLAIKGWYSNKDSKAGKDAVRVTATLLGDLKPTVAFSMSNALEGATLTLYTVMSDGCGLGHVRQGAAFRINGKELTMLDGDSVTATLKTADGETVAAECEITGSDDDHIDATLPAAFSGEACAGRTITFKVTGRCGDPEAGVQEKEIPAVLDAAATPPAPPAPSFTVTGVHNEETEPPAIYVGRSLLFDGTGLDAWGDGDRIEVKRLGDGETDWESITGTDDVTVSAQDGMLWVSTGWWSAISFGVEDGIQIRFRVTIGGTSAETTGTVHED
jgi:hypothetical protein